MDAILLKIISDHRQYLNFFIVVIGLPLALRLVPTAEPNSTNVVSYDLINFVILAPSFLAAPLMITKPSWEKVTTFSLTQRLALLIYNGLWDALLFAFGLSTIIATVQWNRQPDDSRMEPLVALFGIATLLIERYRSGELQPLFEKIADVE
ncbi:MAG: hypothetical protein J0M33_03195 [Anaerolineae bacterium]|nr:hypothetical protein [Anaerolineae bacterium]